MRKSLNDLRISLQLLDFWQKTIKKMFLKMWNFAPSPQPNHGCLYIQPKWIVKDSDWAACSAHFHEREILSPSPIRPRRLLFFFFSSFRKRQRPWLKSDADEATQHGRTFRTRQKSNSQGLPAARVSQEIWHSQTTGSAEGVREKCLLIF